MSSETPDKYKPEPRPWDDPTTLRRLYWGDMLSPQEIADHFDNEVSEWTIREYLEKFDIEMRPARREHPEYWIREEGLKWTYIGPRYPSKASAPNTTETDEEIDVDWSALTGPLADEH